ncbi:MAG: hypothetical protein U0270_27425 [Labilithrix sp.]
MSEPTPSLAPLQIADLDGDKLAELFTDVDALGERVEVVLKRGPARVESHDNTSLASAMQLLTQGRVQGVQLRYRYRGVEWWDTVMRTSDGYRLVRMQQDR